MATVTKPTIDDLMPEVVEFAVQASDLLVIASGAKWKPDLSRGRRSPDMDLTCDRKGVVVKTDDLEETVPWKAVADWVLARRDPDLVSEVRAAYRTYCDVCMEPVSSWENWETDPDHKRLLDEHRARYSTAADALTAAVQAITRREPPATTGGAADPEPADDVPPVLPVPSGPHDVPGLGVVTITPAGWKVLWAAQRAGATGIDQKGITAPTKLRLFADELLAEHQCRLHLTDRGVVLVDWLNRDHSTEPDEASDPGDEPMAAETPAQLMAGLGLTSWITDLPWPVRVAVWDDAPVELTEAMAQALEAMHRAGSTDWYALDTTGDTGGDLAAGGLVRENLTTPGLVMLTPGGREVARWLDPDWAGAAVVVDGPAGPTLADGLPSLTGDLVELDHCTRDRAQELTDAIRGQLGDLWDLVKAAYAERAWVPLGYGSWDAYCAAEFAGKQIRLPREERPETVRSLRDAGMSVRAIASATGLGRGTVARALDDTSGVPNGTPEPDDQALDLGAEHAAPAKVTGADGKRYDRSRPATPTAPADMPRDIPAPPATAPAGEGDQPWEEPPLFTPTPTVIGPDPADSADTLVAECTAAITQFRAAVEQLETLILELDEHTTPAVLELWRGHLIYADGALGDVRHFIGLPRPARAGAA
jgi:hypothetical protein